MSVLCVLCIARCWRVPGERRSSRHTHTSVCLSEPCTLQLLFGAYMLYQTQARVGPQVGGAVVGTGTQQTAQRPAPCVHTTSNMGSDVKHPWAVPVLIGYRQ
jgi:hypothetical protein